MMTTFQTGMLIATIVNDFLLLVTILTSIGIGWYPTSAFAKNRRVHQRASDFVLKAFESFRPNPKIEYRSIILTEEDLMVSKLLSDCRWIHTGWVARSGSQDGSLLPGFGFQMSSEFDQEYDRIRFDLFRENQENQRNREIKRLSKDLRTKAEYQKSKKKT